MAGEASETDRALRKIASGAGIVFLGTMFQVGLAFLAKALMARFLDLPSYGLVSLGILVLNVGATIALLGLDNGIPRFLPRYDRAERRRGAVLSSYQLAVPVSLVVASIIYLFAGELSVIVFQDPSLGPVLRVMAIGVPFWVLLDLGVGVTQGGEDATPRVYAKNVALPLTRFLFVSVVAILGLGLLGMASAYVISYAVAAILITYLVTRRIDFGGSFEIGDTRRRLLTFSAPLLFGGMSSFLVRNVDLVLLGVLKNPESVAIYNVAYPIARLLTIVPGAFGFLFLPVLSDLHAGGQMAEARRVFQLTAKWLFLLTVPMVVVMVLGPRIVISVLFGAKYAAGGLTLSILAVGFFTHAILGLNGDLLNSIGRPRIVMAGQLVALGVNVVLNLALIPRYGFLGAAVATSIAYVLQNLVYGSVLYWTTGIQPFTSSMLRPAMIMAIVAGLTFGLTRMVSISFIELLGLFVLFLGSYALAVLRFGGIDEEDIRLFNAVEAQSGIDFSPVKSVIRSVMR